MHKALKIPLIIFLAILFTACVAIDGWYLYILLKSPDKIVETTYKIGLQETTDGEQRHFIEINYMSNDNKNGLELFEIKYNYMLDEKQEDFYSQGLQYVSYNNNLGWSYYTEPDKFYRSSKYGSWPAYYYDDYYMGSYHPNKDTQVYNYMSADNYEKSTLISTNPIGDTTSFKIQVGDDLFLMKFRDTNENPVIGEGENATLNNLMINDRTFVSRVHGDYSNYLIFSNFYYYNYYCYQDYSLFSGLLYEAIQSVKNGQAVSMIFEFADMFDYYKYNAETGQYNEQKEKNTTLISETVRNFYSIYVSVSADGARSIKDSMFNCVLGNSNYNTTGNYASNGYFTGRSIISCDLTNFEYVATEESGKFKLKLNNSFKNIHDEVKDLIVLDIIIDLDEFNKNKTTFDGFLEDSFDGYKILSCYTTETIDGEIYKTEVVI